MKLKKHDTPKPTESPEQLLARFEKRIKQLTARKDELQGWFDEYLKLEEDLTRLQGSVDAVTYIATCLLYTSPSPRDRTRSRMPSSA